MPGRLGVGGSGLLTSVKLIPDYNEECDIDAEASGHDGRCRQLLCPVATHGAENIVIGGVVVQVGTQYQSQHCARHQ